MRRHLLVLAAPLLLALSCARSPAPLAEAPELTGAPAELGPDLEAAARDLTGDAVLDAARLRLVEGREGDPLALGGGWLLALRRETRATTGRPAGSQCLMVWLGAGSKAGRTVALARADSLRLVEVGAGGEPRLLLLERVAGAGGPRRRLVQRDLEGRARPLAEGPADGLAWEDSPPALRQALTREPSVFREAPGTWHLESRRRVEQGRDGWRLGPAATVESPYRALVDFLEATRHGRWRAARSRADLRSLLALPEGGYSRELEASLRRGSPELLERRRLLKAPRRGPITRLETADGGAAWRVELAALPAPEGGARWVLTRLERVLP